MLIPAAIEHVINRKNAETIKPDVIIGLANGPITSEADAVLNQRNKWILPDILANAGGVTVSYFEWVQNKNGYYWTLDEVKRRLNLIMVKEFHNVYQLAEQHKISTRTAAYVHALKRLDDVIHAQGTQSYFMPE